MLFAVLLHDCMHVLDWKLCGDNCSRRC